MGNGSKDRVNSYDDRIDMVMNEAANRHGDCVVMDKVKTHSYRSLQYRDSRGTNAYKANRSIVSIGLTTPNLGEMADIYSILTGNHVSAQSEDASFTAFVRDFTASEMIQMVGRFRAQYRLDEELHFYIIHENTRGEVPADELLAVYPGATFDSQQVIDFCSEAAGKGDKMRLAISRQLQANPRLGSNEIARNIGVGHATVSSYFKQIGGWDNCSGLLVKGITSKPEQSNSQLIDWETMIEPEVVEYVLTVLDNAFTSPEEKAKEVANITSSLTSTQLKGLYLAIGVDKAQEFIDYLCFNVLTHAARPIESVTRELVAAS
jgi:hypothetical protein